MRLLLLLLLLFLPYSVALAKFGRIEHVIYLTLDGTRWQDVFFSKNYFPIWWAKYATLGKFYGAPHSHTHITVASTPISLPSYQSQMSGSIQPCDDNDCGQIKQETLPEYLLANHFAKKDVAIFSSWWKIRFAAEHQSGKLFMNTGNVPVQDPDNQKIDAMMQILNASQRAELPADHHDRLDKYTFAQALHYFKKYRPKFLWIALTDADEAAHAKDIMAYHRALRFYDRVLDSLFSYLITHHLLADTLVIVTTDHGRGDGMAWTSHGPKWPESKRTYAFVVNGTLPPVQVIHHEYYYSTLSLRPAIQVALLKR